MAATTKDEALHDVATAEPVDVPTCGRIVHVNIGLSAEDPILRPGIVLSSEPASDKVVVKVFLTVFDRPLPYAAGIGVDDVASAKQGDDCGEWRWPVYG